MAPRRRTAEEDTELDPIDEVMTGDRQQTAVELGEALDTIRSLSGSDVEVLVYKVGSGMNAKWQHCKTIVPPIDDQGLLEELRTEFGGGDYALRVRQGGKIKTTKHLSIALPKSATAAPVKDSGNTELMMMLMRQSESSKSDMMQMMMAMNQAQQQSQQTMMTAVMGVITAIIAKPEKDPFSVLPTLMEMSKPKETSLSDTLDVLSKAKGLLGGGEGGGGDSSITGLIGEGLRTLGPVVGELVNQRQQAQQVQIRDVTASQQARGEMPQHPQIAQQTTERYPILGAIREDVLFFFHRQHAPDLAADAVYDALTRQGATIASLLPLVTTFSQSANWLDDLAAEGIDLRSNPVWAQSFLNSLIQAFNEGQPGDSPAGGIAAGGDGGAGNAAHDGEAGG